MHPTDDGIEREFDVPIPGRILEAAHWTKTAIKKLPAEGPIDWESIFGRKAPLVVDFGCGNGRFLLGSASERPEFDHVGVDLLPVVLRYATRRGNQRGLSNLRFACCDAQTFASKYLAPAGVREVHLYHPQPFHDVRESWKRLVTPLFLADLVRVLEAGGTLHLQTDNAPYWNYMMQVVPAFFEFEACDGAWPDSPQGRTRREILAIQRGLPVFRGRGTVRTMTADEAKKRAATLPRPAFDAGRPIRELDAMERE